MEGQAMSPKINDSRHEALELRQLEYDSDITSALQFEGIHQGFVMMDEWGNEWDDTGELGDFDFRTVDG